MDEALDRTGDVSEMDIDKQKGAQKPSGPPAGARGKAKKGRR